MAAISITRRNCAPRAGAITGSVDRANQPVNRLRSGGLIAVHLTESNKGTSKQYPFMPFGSAQQSDKPFLSAVEGLSANG